MELGSYMLSLKSCMAFADVSALQPATEHEFKTLVHTGIPRREYVSLRDAFMSGVGEHSHCQAGVSSMQELQDSVADTARLLISCWIENSSPNIEFQTCYNRTVAQNGAASGWNLACIGHKLAALLHRCSAHVRKFSPHCIDCDWFKV